MGINSLRLSISGVIAFAAVVLCAASTARSDTYSTGLDQMDVAAAFMAPPGHFDPEKAPPAPDYAKDEAWLSLPGRADDGHMTPPGEKDNEATAPVDVFFIHPTTLILSPNGWNAHYDEPGAPLMGLRAVLRGQASAYNGCCRVFAPRYRQAPLYAFMFGGVDSQKALDLAYQDVRAAFNYYLAHENHGRPFIIAGHSQGSLHAMRLAQEIKGMKLFQRLVAVYSIGSSLPEDIEKSGIPICDEPDTTGCILNYNSVTAKADNFRRQNIAPMFLDGSYRTTQGHPLVCVNPLTWRRNDKADAALNLGALTGMKGDELPALVPGAVGAECRDHMLVITITAGTPGFASPLVKNSGDYHIYDYGLFYGNIRRNAQTRVDAYLRKAAVISGEAAPAR